MNQAAVELAQKFRTAHRGLVDFIGSCSDEDWRTYCENEERAVGVVVHHLAFVQGKVVEMVDAALGGSRYSLTAEDVNQINRDHAKDFGDCSRPETIELLNRNGRRLSERVGELTDRQLNGLRDRKSTRLNSSHQIISYAVFCLKKKNKSKSLSTLST